MCEFGLPRWGSGKEPTCQYRRRRRCGFDPWVGKIPWRRKWQSPPVLLPGEFHGQRNLAGYSSWGRKRSDTAVQLSTETAHSVGLRHNTIIWIMYVVKWEWLGSDLCSAHASSVTAELPGPVHGMCSGSVWCMNPPQNMEIFSEVSPITVPHCESPNKTRTPGWVWISDQRGIICGISMS